MSRLQITLTEICFGKNAIKNMKSFNTSPCCHLLCFKVHKILRGQLPDGRPIFYFDSYNAYHLNFSLNEIPTSDNKTKNKI